MKNNSQYKHYQSLVEAAKAVVLIRPNDRGFEAELLEALAIYDVPGRKICHAYWPRPGISAFVSYPSHQDEPTDEQLTQSLKIAVISAIYAAGHENKGGAQ